jgi:hypothetical protein
MGEEVQEMEVLIQWTPKVLMRGVKEGWGTRSKDRNVGTETRQITVAKDRGGQSYFKK